MLKIKKTYYLSLCAIAKNEELYISDWIEYHYKCIGVEKFFIFVNDCNKTAAEVSRVQKEFPVDAHHISGKAKQKKAYEKCLKMARGKTRWLGFLDIDEYLCPHIDNFKEWLRKFEYAPGICIHWRNFGSNGHLEYENKPVVERFLRREKGVNMHVKSIVDPKRTFECFNPHRFTHRGKPVDEKRKQITSPTLSKGTCKYCQINHYITKSLGECLLRRSRLRGYSGEKIGNCKRFCSVHNHNNVEDTRALELWLARLGEFSQEPFRKMGRDQPHKFL
jgi:hypothetical protein